MARKPMSEEKRQAARERLALARAQKGKHKSQSIEQGETPPVAVTANPSAMPREMTPEEAEAWQFAMSVEREDSPHAKYQDDEHWHYFLAINGQDEDAYEIETRCSRDANLGGYLLVEQISPRKAWLKLPMPLYNKRVQAGIDEAKRRWQRPEGQDVRDMNLIQKKESSERYVGAGAS